MKYFFGVILLILYTELLVAGNSLGSLDKSYIVIMKKGSIQKDLEKELSPYKWQEIKSLGSDMFLVVLKKESNVNLIQLQKKFSKSKKIESIEVNQKYHAH
ncbi:MAG: hypothetical protein U0T83_01565 [Bacteriovoracaceae bacterium]